MMSMALMPVPLSYLGQRWYDFCYVIKGTVTFHLHRRKPIIDPVNLTNTTDGGYCLVFTFMRGGVKRQWAEYMDTTQ